MGLQLTPETLAYIAGFFDGEGCVLICKRTTPIKKSVTMPYQIRATVTNTNQAIIRSLKESFGGHVMRYPPHYKRQRRAAWKWTVQCQQAASFLRLILPYLRQKRAEAETALALQDTIDKFKHTARSHPHGHWGQAPLPPEEIIYRDSLHAKLLELRRPIETCN